MITIEEYANKVEVFIDLWRNKLITDLELVNSIDSLSKDVIIIEGNYVKVPTSRIKKKPQVDNDPLHGSFDAGPYWHG